MLNEMYEEWVPIAEALPQLRRYFRTKSALPARGHENGGAPTRSKAAYLVYVICCRGCYREWHHGRPIRG